MPEPGPGFDARSRRRVESRLRVMRFLLWGAILVLLLRFWNLQIARGADFAAIARDNRVQTERLRAPRGVILDRGGEVLATNVPSFALVADAVGLERLEAIGWRFPDGTDLDALRARARRRPEVAASVLDFGEAAWFEARRRELPGVRVDFVPERLYPLGAATAHLLGHVSEITQAQLLLEEFVARAPGDLVGQSGLERAHDAVLRGVDGFVDRIVDSRQRVRPDRRAERVEPVRGTTLRLGISAPVQRAAHAAFADQRGAFAAIHVPTGAVVGIGSYPAAAPAEFLNDSRAFRRLLGDPAVPLLNRAIQGVYPPGSTFKLVTAAAAMAEGVLTPETRLTCRGSVPVGGRAFACHRAGGHGALSLAEAIAASCNAFFYEIARRLDVDTIALWGREFGLGRATGVDLPGEASGHLPTRAWKRRVHGDRWYPSETASVVVGQGAIQVTPIQMARMVAGIAGDGVLPTPRLTGGAEPEAIAGLTPEVYDVIRSGMRSAVLGGTAWRSRIPGYPVAGKTGTAQVANASRVARNNADRPLELRTHAWFVGFAPFEAPEIAVAVVVEHGGGGGAAAAPVARAVIDAWRQQQEAEKGKAVALASGR